MKRILALCLLAGFVQANDTVDEGREMIREGRAELIRAELQLTDEEAAAFWPLYENFRAESDAVMDRYAALIREYLRRYDAADLTDEFADSAIEQYFSIQKDLLGVQESFLPRFRDVMPALKVARFYQLEKKTNSEIDAQIALTVPLMDPS